MGPVFCLSAVRATACTRERLRSCAKTARWRFSACVAGDVSACYRGRTCRRVRPRHAGEAARRQALLKKNTASHGADGPWFDVEKSGKSGKAEEGVGPIYWAKLSPKLLPRQHSPLKNCSILPNFACLLTPQFWSLSSRPDVPAHQNGISVQCSCVARCFEHFLFVRRRPTTITLPFCFRFLLALTAILPDAECHIALTALSSHCRSAQALLTLLFVIEL